jgi:hypothetical protein
MPFLDEEDEKAISTGGRWLEDEPRSEFTSSPSGYSNPVYGTEVTQIPLLPSEQDLEPPNLLSMLGHDISTLGNIFRSVPADIAAGVSGNTQFAGNLPASIREEALPIDEALKMAAESGATKEATLGKLSQGLAATAPLMAVGMLPAMAQKLVALGFSAQMLSEAPELATRLGEEMGKNPEDRDLDKLTSMVSEAIMVGAFAPLAGAHGGRSAVTRVAAPKRYVVEELAKQLKSETQLPEPKTPPSKRELGIVYIPDVLREPGIREIAEQALMESGGNRRVVFPGEESAMSQFSRIAHPPEVVLSDLASVAKRPEGIEGGRISFGASAEVGSIPSARQSSVGRKSAQTEPAIPIEAPKESSAAEPAPTSVPIESKVETKSQDIARYEEIQNAISELGFENASSPEFQALWKENEAIKNKYGGLPPRADAPPKGDSTLGIRPPGSDLLDTFIKFFKRRDVGDIPEVVIDTKNRLPRLPSYEAEKQIATEPRGLAKIPGLGKWLDPRAAAESPVDKSVITRAYSNSKGEHISALWESSQYKNRDLFAADESTGTIPLTDGKRGFISDVIEAEMSKPGSQPITDAQRAWIREEWEPLLKDAREMMAQEGVKGYEIEPGEIIPDQGPYFPRPAVGKRNVPDGKSSSSPSRQMPGAKAFFSKKRLYPTEAEGARLSSPGKPKEEIIYDPNALSRVSKFIRGTYRSVADTRLSKDAALEGKTVQQRYNELLSNHADELASMDKGERVEFEAQLREQAAHPVWQKESYVSVSPAFAGKIFPAEVASKLNKAYGESSHDWVRKLSKGTRIAKGLQAAADMSAPFVQGAGIMFSNPKTWAKATVNSYRSLFDKNVLNRAMELPENKQAANEFVQLGGNIGRLEDWMQGAQKGTDAANIPFYGKRIIEPTGRAFGVFLDMAKIELWKSWREVTPKEQWPAMVEAIENSLFIGRMESIGLHPGRALGERLMMFAPAYYRGTGGLISAAFTKGMPGKMARRVLASYATGVTLVSIGGMLAVGLTWDEIQERLNPAKGKFLKVPVPLPNGSIVEVGIGNVLSSIVRLMGDGVEYLNSDKPIDTGVENNPFLRFLRARSAFFPSLLSDIVTGRDFFGKQISISESLRRRLVPFWTQSLLQGEGTGQQNAADAIFTFMGLQSYPQNVRDLRFQEMERVAQEKFKSPYEQLKQGQQIDVNRVVNKDSRFAPQEPTPGQIEQAFAAQVERQRRINKALNPENRERVSSLSITIPGYATSYEKNGVRVPLTQKQQQAYEAALIDEYNAEIGRWKIEGLSNLNADRRKKWVEKRFERVREIARRKTFK